MGPEIEPFPRSPFPGKGEQTQDCTFCQIALGQLEAHLVFGDENTLAFLDRRPLFPGHCLIVPRPHYETLHDLPADLAPPLFGTVRLVARAVEQATGADGSFVAINIRVSQSVPHLHVHVVPRREGDGLFGRDFVWRRQPYRHADEMRRIADAIRAAILEGSTRAPRG